MRVISVVGYKKTGKTTLVGQIVKALKGYGSVGTIKHLHDHKIDATGTDTWKHREAGADVVIGVTQSELVKFSLDNDIVSALDELADAGMDFAVIEGFKDSRLPKIALGEVDAPDIVIRLGKPEDADIREIVSKIMDQPEYHTLESLIKKIRTSKDMEKAGAIGTFTGIVRAVTKDARTEYLEFEEYGGIARQKMNEICTGLREKEGIIDVLMHHRTGIIRAGEEIVYIVVAAGHREQLFPVLSEAIERLKAEVPIWKKEHTPGGQWWVHDKESR
ncbi:putative molybdopterin synthase [uncultured archaeon]|nr:putative molybdopterin synthase [uncultured archaeon]